MHGIGDDGGDAYEGDVDDDGCNDDADGVDGVGHSEKDVGGSDRITILTMC